MIIPHSTHDLDIKVPDKVTKVGLKISGGADSAITGYILSKYVATERPEIKIIPITVDQEGKAYQVLFAKKVIDFYKDTFGERFFSKHETAFSPIPEANNYIKTQDELTQSLYKNNVIQFHFAGITLNPPVGSIPKTVYDDGWIDPPDRKRTGTLKNIYVDSRCLPLINFDKKAVAELYNYFNVFDTLFPLTRSCEIDTDDFSHHCGKCWFCAEREWGFGKL